jgi:hypothetical protein
MSDINKSIHRISCSSDSSERTLYVSYYDLQDAFKSSIYDEPEIHACDCATKLAFNKKLSENQIQMTNNEPSEPSEPNEPNESNKPQQEQSQQPPQQMHNQVFVLFFLVSIISYVIGYFGLTSVWLIIILYQSIIWYTNTVKDNKERVLWEVKREMSIDKVTYKISFIYFVYLFICYLFVLFYLFMFKKAERYWRNG